MAQPDEPRATWMPVPESIIFPDYNGHTPCYVVIHKTASAGTAQDIARYFGNLTENTGHVSSHYIVGDDGAIVQAVSEQNAAGANCCLEPGHASFLPTDINLNLISISIEHTDSTPDNSTPLTSTQKAASFQLIKHICDRHGIPKRPGDANGGIIGHYQIAPRTRAHCPGTYPWQELFAYLRGEQPMGLITNNKGMIADYIQVSQFEGNETEFACGFFAGALNKYAGFPGKGPTSTSSDVDVFADREYDLVYGSHGPGQTGGISIPELHTVLMHAGLHWWDIQAIAPGSALASDLAHITRALDAGYPVVITLTEASVRDITEDIPAGNPYEWGPVCDANNCPTHVITLVGHGPGYLLAVDPANVVGPLQGSNSVRPWPRKYDVNTIDITFATIVQLPWLAPIPSGDPTTWAPGFIAQQGGTTMTTPAGWHDDGTTLTAPNGHKVVQGFRQYILSNPWDPANVPLDEEFSIDQLETGNPSLGKGTQQFFRWAVLEWSQARGVFAMWTGQELLATRAQVAKYYQQCLDLQKQVTDLEAKVQQAGQGGQAVTDIQAIKAAVAPILAKY